MENLNAKNGKYKFGSFSFDYDNHLLKSPTYERRLTNREADVLNLLCIMIILWDGVWMFTSLNCGNYLKKIHPYLLLMFTESDLF